MTPMLFSVGYAGLWGQHRLDLKSFLARAGALGYPAVELMGKRPHLSILDHDEHALDALRDAAATAGVEIATIAGYTNFTLGRDTEIPAVEIQVAYVRQLARLARRLGAGSSGSSPATWSTRTGFSATGRSASAPSASAPRWPPIRA